MAAGLDCSTARPWERGCAPSPPRCRSALPWSRVAWATTCGGGPTPSCSATPRHARAHIAEPVPTRRAGRGVGPQPPRVGAARVRRRVGRDHTGHGQPELPTCGGRVRARPVPRRQACSWSRTCAATLWHRMPTPSAASCRSCAQVLRLDQLVEHLAAGNRRRRAPRGARPRSRADPVHQWHHRLSEGCRAAPRQRHQQRQAVGRPSADPGRRGLALADAPVPHRRLRDGRPRSARPARRAGADADVRTRSLPPAHRAGAGVVRRWGADDADRS